MYDEGARLFAGRACLCECVWCLTQNRVFLSIHVPIWSFTAAFENAKKKKTAKQNLWWFSIEKLSFPLGVLNAFGCDNGRRNGYNRTEPNAEEWSAPLSAATIQLESFKINRIYRTTLNNSMGLSSKSMFALLFGLRFYVSLLSDREGGAMFLVKWSDRRRREMGGLDKGKWPVGRGKEEKMRKRKCEET